MSKIEELSIDQLCDKIESHGDAQYSARNEIKIRFADLELKLIDETALRMSHEGHIEKLEKQLAEVQAENNRLNKSLEHLIELDRGTRWELTRQIEMLEAEAAKGKAAMEFAEKCVAEFQDGIDDTNKEYFYQFMREYIDKVIDGVCKQSCKKYEVEKGKAAIKAMEKISIVLDFYNSSDEIKEMIVKVNNKYQEAVCQK